MDIKEWLEQQVQVMYVDGGSMVGKMTAYNREGGYLVLRELGGNEEIVIMLHAVKTIRVRLGDTGPTIIRRQAPSA